MLRLDLRNLITPFCLLKASNAFRSLNRGDTMEILYNDPENLTKLMKIIPSGSCTLLSVKRAAEPEPGIKARLKKMTP